mmetsp:Transcript_69561/g.197284  ORF Transcript_69561/g.197284 Transcript_69561/m.197284 type:complete len:253 (-) Transcript_69561:900-1658(-)
MGWGRLRPNLHDRVRVQVRRGAILQVRHLQRGLAPRDGGAGPEGHGARAPCGHDVEQPPREVFLHTHEPHRPSLDPAHVGGASDQAARGKQRGRGHEPDIPAGPAAVPDFPHPEVRQIQLYADSSGGDDRQQCAGHRCALPVHTDDRDARGRGDPAVRESRGHCSRGRGAGQGLRERADGDEVGRWAHGHHAAQPAREEGTSSAPRERVHRDIPGPVQGRDLRPADRDDHHGVQSRGEQKQEPAEFAERGCR